MHTSRLEEDQAHYTAASLFSRAYTVREKEKSAALLSSSFMYWPPKEGRTVEVLCVSAPPTDGRAVASRLCTTVLLYCSGPSFSSSYYYSFISSVAFWHLASAQGDP